MAGRTTKGDPPGRGAKRLRCRPQGPDDGTAGQQARPGRGRRAAVVFRRYAPLQRREAAPGRRPGNPAEGPVGLAGPVPVLRPGPRPAGIPARGREAAEGLGAGAEGFVLTPMNYRLPLEMVTIQRMAGGRGQGRVNVRQAQPFSMSFTKL